MTIEIRNPANPLEVVGTFPTLSSDEVPGVAIAAARSAQRDYANWFPWTRYRAGSSIAFSTGYRRPTEDIGTLNHPRRWALIGESRSEVSKALGEGRATTRRASSHEVAKFCPAQETRYRDDIFHSALYSA